MSQLDWMDVLEKFEMSFLKKHVVLNLHEALCKWTGKRLTRASG